MRAANRSAALPGQGKRGAGAKSVSRGPNCRLDVSVLRHRAQGDWYRILPALGVSPQTLVNRHGPCPGCGGCDRFRFDDQDGRGTFICSQGGGEIVAGDGFDLLQHVHGWTFREALEAVARALVGAVALQESRKPRVVSAPRSKRRATLDPDVSRRLWGPALRLDAADAWPARWYFDFRECEHPPVGGDVRFLVCAKHWLAGRFGPALVSRITDAETGEPVTLHLTWIAPPGSGIPADEKGKADFGEHDSRLVLRGHTNVGVVRLWPDEEVTTGLFVAEGLESSLSVARWATPVWAAMNKTNMRKLPHLAGIECLTIVPDLDSRRVTQRSSNKYDGEAAAETCAVRWATKGTDVRIWRGNRFDYYAGQR